MLIANAIVNQEPPRKLEAPQRASKGRQSYLLVLRPRLIGNMFLWQHFNNNKNWTIYIVVSCMFCDTFKVKCPVSDTKSTFSFIQNRWTWICQLDTTVVVSVCIVAVVALCPQWKPIRQSTLQSWCISSATSTDQPQAQRSGYHPLLEGQTKKFHFHSETHSVYMTWRRQQQYYNENKRFAFFLCVNIWGALRKSSHILM